MIPSSGIDWNTERGTSPVPGGGDINVADISVKYGGGGHAKAAGCTLRQSIGTAKEEILKAAEEELCRVF